MYSVLICDDDKAIVRSIEIYLKAEGYDTISAYDGQQAIELLKENEVHCIIMDIMMPVLDGINATLKIREKSNVPIIFLSAKSEDTDKIAGLGFGGDDYVTKPFNPLELIARVKSQLRRYVNLGSMAGSPVATGVYKSGGLIVDDNEKRVTLDGEQVVVTPIEFGILKLLTENAGRVFSIDQIYESVWNEPAYSPENTVAVHIRRIREKIEIDPKNPRYLKVVWGIGYKIEKIN